MRLRNIFINFFIFRHDDVSAIFEKD